MLKFRPLVVGGWGGGIRVFYGRFENNPLSCDSNRRVSQIRRKLFAFFTLKMTSRRVFRDISYFKQGLHVLVVDHIPLTYEMTPGFKHRLQYSLGANKKVLFWFKPFTVLRSFTLSADQQSLSRKRQSRARPWNICGRN